MILTNVYIIIVWLGGPVDCENLLICSRYGNVACSLFNVIEGNQNQYPSCTLDGNTCIDMQVIQITEFNFSA